MNHRSLPVRLALAIAVLASLHTATHAATLSVDQQSTAATEDGSADAPFKSIAAAAAAAKPGDTITIREGVYREAVRLPSGEAGRPITIRAEQGARVIVSGCVKLDGWKPAGPGTWTTVLDWKPARLLVRGRPQQIARTPSEGWWRAASAGNDWLADLEHLRGLDLRDARGSAYVWLGRGNVFGTFPIRSLDAASGRLSLDGVKRPGTFSDGDRYYLQNRAAWIDGLGQWAVEPQSERFKVTFRPVAEADLKQAEAPKSDASLLYLRNGGHLRIEGLQLVGSRRNGIEIHTARDVQVRRCVAYANAGTGISLRDVTDGLLQGNISWRNEYGISVSYSKQVTVEHNDVGYNGTDGLTVTWKSDDVTVRRNFLHHHVLWGHPDNFQVYRDVTRLRFEENLLLCAGQSVMTEETRDGVFQGNMMIGCGAYMLIFGHGNAGHYKITGNTLALPGYGCMSLTGEDYEVRENVFYSGHAGTLYGVRGVKRYRADRNLLYNSDRVENPQIMATDAGWLRDFDAVRRSTGQDEQSVYANPRFRHAPVAFAVLESRRLTDCTRAKLFLRGGAAAFRAGDRVEVNFDGQARHVTGVDGDAIVVNPPLEAAPTKCWQVANWGDTDDLRLDLRLEADSPGAKLAEGGGPVGSQIDIQAYRQGDFDNDGRRDLPDLPPELNSL